MAQIGKDSALFRIADLDPGGTHEFALTPGANDRAALASTLEISAIRKLRFEGRLEPLGASDWTLAATLGATIVQACVVTLEPVTTRLDLPVVRKYLASPPDAKEGEEVEVPEDDTVEPLPAIIDLSAVLVEALALALPEYPRVDGVAVSSVVYTEPGKDPLTDAEVKPFAGLASLKDKLSQKN